MPIAPDAPKIVSRAKTKTKLKIFDLVARCAAANAENSASKFNDDAIRSFLPVGEILVPAILFTPI